MDTSKFLQGMQNAAAALDEEFKKQMREVGRSAEEAKTRIEQIGAQMQDEAQKQKGAAKQIIEQEFVEQRKTQQVQNQRIDNLSAEIDKKVGNLAAGKVADLEAKLDAALKLMQSIDTKLKQVGAIYTK